MAYLAPTCCPSNQVPVAPPEGYEEQGCEFAINGRQCYEVGNENSAMSLLVVSDIFGWRSGRTRQICDKYAAEGFHVLLPNFFQDDGSNHAQPLSGFLAISWYLTKRILFYRFRPRLPRTCCSLIPASWLRDIGAPIQDDFLPYLTKNGTRKVGVLGFCWGGWVAIRAAALPQVACAIAAHPTMSMEGMHGGKLEDVYGEVKAPLMSMPAGDDPDHAKQQGGLGLALRNRICPPPYEIHEFQEMKHGWFPRGDTTDRGIAMGVTKAFEMGRDFLRRYLS